MDEPHQRIGDLARATGTKVVTIRYYEKTGLLPVPPRTASGQRRYGAEAVARLRFIRRARALGFPLDRVRALIELSRLPEADCASIDRIAAAHLAEVEQKIADLRALATELRATLERCRGSSRIADCRVIGSLAADRVPQPST